MLGIKISINNHPLTEDNHQSEVVDLDLQLTVKIVTQQIMAVLSAEEANQIALNFETGEESLVVSVTGYEEAVEKAIAAIGDE